MKDFVHALSFVRNKLSQNCLKQQLFYLPLIPWVSNLDWAQLGGSSVGFTWGQSHGCRYLVAYLRRDSPKWFHSHVRKLVFVTSRESLLLFHVTSYCLVGYSELLHLVVSGKQERADPSVPLSTSHLLLTYWSKWITQLSLKAKESRNKFLSHDGRRSKIVLQWRMHTGITDIYGHFLQSIPLYIGLYIFPKAA